MIYKPQARCRFVMGDPLYVKKYGRFWGWALIYALNFFGWLYRAMLVAAIVVCAKLVFS